MVCPTELFPILPIIIGNAGTIVAETMTAFDKLGLSTSAGLTLAKRLAVDSIRRTAKMRRARLSHAAGSPDWHTQDGGGATGPATGADATLPAADPQPDSNSDTGSESADDDNNVEHQPGEALYPPTPSTEPHTANQTACADQQALGCTPAPRNGNEWQIVTRSKRRAQSQPLCSLDTQTQTSSCSQDPAHGCKRPRATFSVLSTLQDDDHDDPLPPPPPVEARGQKRGRSRGDLAATSTAPKS